MGLGLALILGMAQNILLGNPPGTAATRDPIEGNLTFVRQTASHRRGPSGTRRGRRFGLRANAGSPRNRGRRGSRRERRGSGRRRYPGLRPARFRINFGQAGPHRHHVALGGENLHHDPCHRRGNLRIHLVGGHLDQGLVDFDAVPRRNQPSGNRPLDHAFPKRGKFNPCSHFFAPLIALVLIPPSLHRPGSPHSRHPGLTFKRSNEYPGAILCGFLHPRTSSQRIEPRRAPHGELSTDPRICALNLLRPSSNASARGGQPGINISTGRSVPRPGLTA